MARRSVNRSNKKERKSAPGVIGAVVGVDGESGIVADEAARHLDRIQSARLELVEESAVEPVDVVHVAEEALALLPAQRCHLALFSPVIQISLKSFQSNSFIIHSIQLLFIIHLIFIIMYIIIN